MTVLSMENRKILLKEIINQHPDTKLLESIRKSDHADLRGYLSNIRLDVLDSFGDTDEMGVVDLDKMIDFFDELSDKQLHDFNRQYILHKLEKWCNETGECDLIDNLTINERLLATGAAMTAANQITTSSTNLIKGFLSNPQQEITESINTSPSTNYGTILAIGALSALTALGFMYAYRQDIRRGYTSLKEGFKQILFAYVPKSHNIDDYDLGAALHRL